MDIQYRITLALGQNRRPTHLHYSSPAVNPIYNAFVVEAAGQPKKHDELFVALDVAPALFTSQNLLR
jgi:hypothetical protein